MFTAAVVYWPPAQALFGTTALPGWLLPLLLVFPVLVWGADEALRAVLRRGRGGPNVPEDADAGPSWGGRTERQAPERTGAGPAEREEGAP